jgi:hypothetical protein
MTMSDEHSGAATIRERVNELYRRLRALPNAANAESALAQLCQTLEEVEDELSGIVKKSPPPPPNMPDGRMYCPTEDHTLRRSDGSILALTRGHRIEITGRGAMQIINKITMQIEFEK